MQIGKTIAHYNVTTKLGAGGMGEVYRATDTKLGRDVALKVLPDAVAADAQRMARFQREAQVLASLNHPNIAGIYGLEESGATRALAMELVEGPTLAERIQQGPLPFDEALTLARQIAEALEYAHERGIIHRDLKPANIKLTREGQVKVLDFGLAKALADDVAQGDRSNSPTLSLAATKAGVILGTAAYMSPEQAKGKVVDRRADIWSFGVVLYEMLTGRMLYAGETAAETLAQVIERKPDLSALPAATPAMMRRLLRRCLTMDPRQRLQAIGEARVGIEEYLANPAATEAESADRTPALQMTPSKLPWAVAGVLALAVLALVWRQTQVPLASQSPLRKFEIPAEDLRTSVWEVPRISPDGRKLVYGAGDKLWIREFDQLAPRVLVDSGRPTDYFWSPDSALVGYISADKLWKVAASGGTPITIAAGPSRGNGFGAAWTPDGKIVLARALAGHGLDVVADRGGDLAPLLEPQAGEADFHDPSLLPGGRGVLYVVDRGSASGGLDTIAALSGSTRKEILRVKGERFRSPFYSPTGHLLYERERNNPGIWAVPFSLAKLETTGEPFLVAPGASLPSYSTEGTLTFVRESARELRRLAWVDRNGKIVDYVGDPQEFMRNPALSPDGRWVVTTEGEEAKTDLWIYDLTRNTRTRLTFEKAQESYPTWSPDGKHVYYHTWDAVWRKAADGSGVPEEIAACIMPAISRDGKFLACVRRDGWDLVYTPLAGERKLAPLTAPQGQFLPRFSPDGRFLVSVSGESGRPEVFLRRFPAGEGKWQVSSNSGTTPQWSRSGKKLFYIDEPGQLMEVDVETTPAVRLGIPRVVFSRIEGVEVFLPYEVAGDGSRFLAVVGASTQEKKIRRITVVQNWFAEFKEKQKK